MLNIKQAGYTLIEILIVIVIISIVAGFAVLTIGHNQNKRIEYFAKQLTSLITLAEQQAMLQPAELGFSIEGHYFQFYHFESIPGKWKVLVDPLLGQHLIPNDIQVSIRTNTAASEEKEETPKPKVIISSSGDLTPFTIFLGSLDQTPKYQIIGKADGKVSLEYFNEN